MNGLTWHFYYAMLMSVHRIYSSMAYIMLQVSWGFGNTWKHRMPILFWAFCKPYEAHQVLEDRCRLWGKRPRHVLEEARPQRLVR